MSPTQVPQELLILRKQHHALYPPYLLVCPAPSTLAKSSSQNFLVEHILYDPALRGRRPEQGYERLFWRKVVEAVERGVRELQLAGDEDAEVDERLYEALAEFMVSNESGPSSLRKQSYRTFLYDHPKGKERKVTLLEEQVVVQGGTTGLRTWTAALHLAHHLLTHPHLVFPTAQLPPLVELGAGTGFVSILLSQLGADIVASDISFECLVCPKDEGGEVRLSALDRLRENVELNADSGLARKLEVLELDWMEAMQSEVPNSTWQRLRREGRSVVAADVIYDPDLVPPLVSAIALLLSPLDPTTASDKCAIIAATVRNEATFELFMQTCLERHLLVSMLELPAIDADRPTFWESALDRGTPVRIMRIEAGA